MSDSASLLAGIEKIQKGALREQIQALIKKLILTNRLHPGQSIVIDHLASELGVSHTPVREALAMLQRDGLVRTKPYENPRVTEIDASDVREVWEMRILLEGWVAGKAALTLSDEALGKISESLQKARQHALKSSYDAHLESDIAMHEMILQTADNSLFERLAQLVNDRSTRIRWLVEATGSSQDVLTIIDEHYTILEALQARDPELTRQRLISHLEAGMKRTLAAVEKIAAKKE
jgi:DNA-binding GntR family transcriptional regulator